MTRQLVRPLQRTWILWALLALLLLLPFLGEPYYVKLATRMVVFGLAALSLDLLVGYMGLISFGHAAFMGVGAYTVGILASNGVDVAWVAWPLAMLAGAVLALCIGAVSLRCNGLYFIFITLAFSQMVFYGAQSLRQYGGDDGFSLEAPSVFFPGVDASDHTVLFYVATFLLLAVLYVCKRLVASPFGRVAVGVRDNEPRLEAVGVQPYPYKLAMFVVSGAIAALAGALMANLTGFVSPGYVSWLVSGELLIMVILGSFGTLVGPILGAALFVLFEYVLSDWTEHWMLVFGPLLVLRVLLLKDGIYGLLLKPGQASAASPAASAHVAPAANGEPS
ncbi:branched-chain amino acid ABC transporter permease [Eoetvoesiella caeni]|uniref:Amino acid/amide ABC transporter membrane protein 2 (HAAT family) n=1 Tax=Eoetvoesiella caeni TaxID=645616 RepID=A0A366HG60_9BURK|nr:branched-chain amino acid ABC transporter permease [Eoetvoesiella caeni]MCI2807729.1 branched-chain amino acid ABC transporter permease [Eoetvoesiella caeni]NYT54264.1 branched-chain amino acid ABC transporter permease [Eoetvoesiella caeni]RBP41644.1 amino acid/amide ABC transporter membrane protein 2 (HAAT family) [Eoetvoesiella caeni]